MSLKKGKALKFNPEHSHMSYYSTIKYNSFHENQLGKVSRQKNTLSALSSEKKNKPTHEEVFQDTNDMISEFQKK